MSSVTYGMLLVLLFVLIAVAGAMLASHLRTRRPRTEAHHGRPMLDPSSFGDVEPRHKGDTQAGPSEASRQDA